MSGNGRQLGFGLIEVFISITIAVLLGVVVWENLRPRKSKAPFIRCVNNLKNVGLAFQIFAVDHNDQFPGAILATNSPAFSGIDVAAVFQSLSNELSAPKVVLCPADKDRVAAPHFGNLSNVNVSYFASLTATESKPLEFLGGDGNISFNGKPAAGLFPLRTNLQLTWSKDIHHGRGNIVFADGSVQQMTRNNLNQAVRQQPTKTNFLVFPAASPPRK